MRVRLATVLLVLAFGAGEANAQRFGGNGFRPDPAGGLGHGPLGGGFGFGFGLPIFLAPPEPIDEAPPPRRRPVRAHPQPVDDNPPPPHHIRAHSPIEKTDAAPPPRKLPRIPQIVHLPPPPLKPPPPRAVLALPARARPPLGETRYREGEVLVETAEATPQALIDATARRHGLVEAEATRIDLLGLTVRLWRIPNARKASAVIAELAAEGALARIQPNYLFLAADEPSPPNAMPQYALDKMKVVPTLEDGGAPVRVAVIDTAVDGDHPDLKQAIEARFDALGGKIASRDHGTAMAGGIAANGRLRGVATKVKLLSARAFDTDGTGGALGSTLSILKCLDWAAAQRAAIINMSFAGPDDPTLRDALAAASARGLVLVSAAGNLGPKAAPQYPGADPHVIAATATDSDDRRFSGANVGAYVAISAPGVDVLLPSPGGGYAMETGTSVSSALVAGVAALMLERNAMLKPDEVRARLSSSARALGARPEFGAGLVDAAKAVGR